MRNFEELKKTSIDDLKKDIDAEMDYLLRRAASCYEGDNVEEVIDELDVFSEEMGPIIYEKLKEAYFIGKIEGINMKLKSTRQEKRK